MTVSVFQATIVNREGTAQANASVEVRDESDNSIATIYSDRAGITPLSNPTTADANGFVRFYTGPGAYKITATKSGETNTWRHVALGLSREFDTSDWLDWVPDLFGTTVAGANSYDVQIGKYKIINGVCTAYASIRLDGTSGALNSTGQIRLNIPVTVNDEADIYPVIVGQYTNMAMSSGRVLYAHVNSLVGAVRFYQGNETATSFLSDGAFTDSTRLDLTLIYEAA